MKINVLGLKIDAVTKKQILEKIALLLTAGRSIFLVTPYSESVVRAQHDKQFRDILNSADIALPDGIGVLWSAHYLKYKTNLIFSLFKIIFVPQAIRDPIPEKISGVDLIWDLAKLADQNKYSIFLLGGFGNVSELVAVRLRSRYPNLKIAGTASPSIQEQGRAQDIKLIEQINSSRADFLFVAMGPIKQEKWLFEHRAKLQPRLLIGLGGTFDYLAGTKPRAPKWWQEIGLEWTWRLITQPKRIFRITKGIFGLIYFTVKQKMAYPKASHLKIF